MDTRCWLAIVYDWGDEGLTLARTADPALLSMAKQQVIQEAERRLRISREVDQVVSMLDESELRRLNLCLDVLIPGSTGRDLSEASA